MENIFKLIEKEDVRFVDLRFTDTLGQRLHVSIPAQMVNQTYLQEGKMQSA